jgi:hypothetical protein
MKITQQHCQKYEYLWIERVKTSLYHRHYMKYKNFSLQIEDKTILYNTFTWCHFCVCLSLYRLFWNKSGSLLNSWRTFSISSNLNYGMCIYAIVITIIQRWVNVITGTIYDQWKYLYTSITNKKPTALKNTNISV